MDIKKLTGKQLDKLKASALLKGMTSEEIEAFLSADGCTYATYEKGEAIITRNDTRRFLIYIVKGRVEVFTSDAVYQMRRIEAGDYFGVASLFNEEGYVTDVIAGNASAMIMFEQSLVEDCIRNCPAFALNYITFLGQRIRFLNRRIALLTNDSSQHSLNGYLLRAYERWGSEFTMPLSCAALARTLNISRSALYRGLADLEKQNIIGRHGRMVTILNVDALKGE